MAQKQYYEIDERLRSFDIYTLIGKSVIALAADLQGFQDDYPGYSNLRFVVEYYDGYCDIELWGTRQETDKERDKRLEKARKARETRKKNKAKKIEQEKKELARLKAKYE